MHYQVISSNLKLRARIRCRPIADRRLKVALLAVSGGPLMLTPIAAMTALSVLAPGELGLADQAHYWTPSPSLVKGRERQIAVPASLGGPLTNFDRYYAGVYRDRRKIVFVEMVNLTQRLPGSGTVQVVRPSDVPAIADFGCGVVRLSYDPGTESFSELECNAEGTAPPPPPGR